MMAGTFPQVILHSTCLIDKQCLKLSQKSCRSSCLESQTINIKLKKNQQKVLGPPPKLPASDWRTCGNFQHCRQVDSLWNFHACMCIFLGIYSSCISQTYMHIYLSKVMCALKAYNHRKVSGGAHMVMHIDIHWQTHGSYQCTGSKICITNALSTADAPCVTPHATCTCKKSENYFT